MFTDEFHQKFMFALPGWTNATNFDTFYSGMGGREESALSFEQREELTFRGLSICPC